MARFDASNLTQLQLDGVTCVVCGQIDDRPMTPVGPAPSGLVDLHAHRTCLSTEPASTSSVLVIGPTALPSDVERLRHVAWNVAYELGAPAVVAIHADYRVTDFAAVYLTGDVESMRDASTLVLLGEALAAGMDVHEPLNADESVTCDCGLVHHFTRPNVDERGTVWCAECREESGCAHCGEWNDVEDLEIVQNGDAWIPLHPGCRAGLSRSKSSSVALAAV
ncbi:MULTISPECIES: hypothetical protein [unclassified Streptomyces]|uniref:hypothetical protein n=1 Tax=unclassified Streptomyces TaxID=2593676 RepID=UPI0036FB0F52